MQVRVSATVHEEPQATGDAQARTEPPLYTVNPPNAGGSAQLLSTVSGVTVWHEAVAPSDVLTVLTVHVSVPPAEKRKACDRSPPTFPVSADIPVQEYEDCIVACGVTVQYRVATPPARQAHC